MPERKSEEGQGRTLRGGSVRLLSPEKVRVGEGLSSSDGLGGDEDLGGWETSRGDGL